MVPEVTPVSVASELTSATPPAILDVREDDEVVAGHIEGSIHIPLSELSDRIEELDSSKDWVIVCRSGARSAKAAGFLMDQGFDKVRNMITGMKGYAATVDPSITVA